MAIVLESLLSLTVGSIMHRKTIITLMIVLSIALCVAVEAGAVVYVVLNTPNLRQSLQNAGPQLAGMPELQSDLIETYPCRSIEIRAASGHILHIFMVNTGFLDLAELERQAKAKEIATFIVHNYESIDTIDTIKITFIERETVAVVINVERDLTYTYYVNDLQ